MVPVLPSLMIPFQATFTIPGGDRGRDPPAADGVFPAGLYPVSGECSFHPAG